MTRSENTWMVTVGTYYNSLGAKCFLAEDLHFKLSSFNLLYVLFTCIAHNYNYIIN